MPLASSVQVTTFPFFLDVYIVPIGTKLVKLQIGGKEKKFFVNVPFQFSSSDPLASSIYEYLSKYRLMHQYLRVLSATLVPIRIRGKIYADDQDACLAALMDAQSRFLDEAKIGKVPVPSDAFKALTASKKFTAVFQLDWTEVLAEVAQLSKRSDLDSCFAFFTILDANDALTVTIKPLSEAAAAEDTTQMRELPVLFEIPLESAEGLVIPPSEPQQSTE